MPNTDTTDAETRLDEMLAEYERMPKADGKPADEADGYLRNAIEASPALRRNLVQAIEEDKLEGFTKQTLPGALAFYTQETGLMSVPSPDHGTPMDLVFVLGHETQHALDRNRYLEETFFPAIGKIAASEREPHDYTGPIGDRIEHSRTAEARAEIGGYNAVISAMQQAGWQTGADHLARAMPSMSRSFIVPDPAHDGAPALRPYQRNADGTLPFTAENVDRLKVVYADTLPASLGPTHIFDYRHNTLLKSLDAIHAGEQQRLRGGDVPWMSHMPADGAARLPGGPGGGDVAMIPVTDASKSSAAPAAPAFEPIGRYHVDFAALGINRAVFRYPSDGMVTVSDREPAPDAFRHDHPECLVPTLEALQRLEMQKMVPDDPALLRDAREGLARLGPVPGLADDPARDAAAAAMALKAAELGMTRIDHVLASRDGGGLILAQGRDLAAPQTQLARIDLDGMPPAAQSLAKLDMMPPPARDIAPLQAQDRVIAPLAR